MLVQIEDSGKVKSRSTLPSSQHLGGGGVEGHVGAPRWDQEE